ncbi:MAG: primosomal protein N' [Gammaproteobacteria bacterium]|nr:primosomal protein N' [Gammaproteobacteria bacterium]NIM74151.1 primosomal protein N' [Gammaproteobacteria bacterium]NIN39034.1 primosomal protein N' [Gammaproteobacteria bacterium]NIO25927.1 primosomal protein N' [Gammaproteobacteria bacterium]NIO66558.1 primosomal protein N' [Gammaproteobacteria bacterium]
MTDAPAPLSRARAARPRLLRVAVPSPLRRAFDYLPLYGGDGELPVPGTRVRVPFGKGSRVGVVLELLEHSEVPPHRLKRIAQVLDEAPLLDPGYLEFLRWASDYFHHPIGEVVTGALPARLRAGKPMPAAGELRWRLSAAGRALGAAQLARAPRQEAVWRRLLELEQGARQSDLAVLEGDWRGALKAMSAKGWVACVHTVAARAHGAAAPRAAPPTPSDEQRAAIEAVYAARDRFQSFLLDGVTGSGKTEVYLAVIERIVALGRQTLMLIPEIGLTPQIVGRLRERLSMPMAVLHSGLSDSERMDAWAMARDGRASVVVGTRSAVFAPLARPGLFVVDEEHDASFKQQDGFRYSARDLAIVRARQCGVPVLLGSATPSLESLNNVETGRHQSLRLSRRAQGALVPRIEVVDLRGQPFEEGVSGALTAAIADCLAEGEQALLFVNRRGYAPILICHACGWQADCSRCDAHMVYHRRADRLRCHHCAAEQEVPTTCPDCGDGDLRALGLGTQRVVDALEARFPDARIDRVDRDSTRRKGAMQKLLDAIHSGRTNIVVGTQMLAKGHHFPNVTLVGILDADGGLFGADFRAAERMAQLLVQVAGRAGRGQRPGRVLIQTHHPDHPLLQVLIREGYRHFGEAALAERRQAALPPFSCFALLRAEAPQRERVMAFLEEARARAVQLGDERVQSLGPVPAPMERRAGRFRAQLLVQSTERPALHALLAPWLSELEALQSARRVRWSLDVDPQEML